MQALKQFSLPIIGLKIGMHHFAFNIDGQLFKTFENAVYSDCSISAHLDLEKKSDHLSLSIKLDGTINLDCDRCTDSIDFPISSIDEFKVKFDIDEREEESIVYINPEATVFNCAKLIYESIIIGLPMYKTCDVVVNKDCNPEVVNLLERQEEEKSENLLTEALKNLKIN